MLFLRRLGLTLVIALFATSLVMFAFFLTAYKVLDTPGTIKKALATSGIYDVFVQNTLNQQREQGKTDLSTGNTSQDDAIRQALTGAFSSGFLRQTTEKSLDNVYDWLHGKTGNLKIGADLSGPKQNFANAIATQAQARAGELPPCTEPVAAPTTVEELLALSCLPPGTSPEQVAQTAHQLALESNIFDSLSLTSGELKDENGQPLSKKLAAVPEAHRYFIASLYAVPLFLILCALAIIFGSATKRGGTKRVGQVLLWTGALSLVWATLAAWGLNSLAKTAARNAEGGAAAVQDNFLRAVNTLAADMRLWWMIIGGAYLLGGIGLLIAVRRMNQRTVHKAEALNESLGYTATPPAGTTFDPEKKLPVPTEKPPKQSTKTNASSSKTKNSPK